MECPKCKTDNKDTTIMCGNCGLALSNPDTEKLSAFLPSDTPGLSKTGGYSKGIYETVISGTYLWKKVGWKGVFIFLLSLILISLLAFIAASFFQ